MNRIHKLLLSLLRSVDAKLPSRTKQCLRTNLRLKRRISWLKRVSWIDAEHAISTVKKTGERGLFIDCGSNVGQGFRFFSARFPLEHFDYVLMEPNPFCHDSLEAIVAESSETTTLIKAAASTSAGETTLYGLEQVAHGKTNEGASIVQEHNSALYNAPEQGVTVKTFSLANYILEQSARYSTIVIKMDIEGAECDVLEDVIAVGANEKLHTVYVEFHAQYQVPEQRAVTAKREDTIARVFDGSRSCFRVWI